MLITQQKDLIPFMEDACKHPFLTVDTEFLREKTYYPKLCLVQIGTPDGKAAAIDPLSKDIDMTPVLDMLRNPNILKVFHAARQDLEIFYKLMGEVPAPLFDTQIAAMVCGHGDQIGYESLVRTLTNGSIDKTSQFTNWSNRPLTDKQIDYALGDVTHLVEIYQKLDAELAQRGRTHWLAAEEEILNAPETYDNDPNQAWERIKIKTHKAQTLAILRTLAAWRESKAQRKDIPRTWIFRDETLADLAAHPPKTASDLKKIRGFPSDRAEGRTGQEILGLVKTTMASDPKDWPQRTKKKPPSAKTVATIDVLKTLLKVTAGRYEVAAKLIASNDDLEAIAAGKDETATKALRGWRKEIFGDLAVQLKNGKIAMGFKNGEATIFEIPSGTKTL